MKIFSECRNEIKCCSILTSFYTVTVLKYILSVCIKK